MRFQGQTSDEKLDALERFFVFWLGARKPEYGAAAGELDDLPIPDSLRRFYAFCYNWPGRGRGLGRGIGAFSTQNKLLRLASSDCEAAAENQGLMIIAQEDQGVTNWAIPLGEDDPKVYEMDYGDEVVDDPDWPYQGWHVRSDSVADFLVEFCLHELFWSGTQVNLTPLKEKFRAEEVELELLLGTVLSPGAKLYLYDEDFLVLRHTNWKAPASWMISARNKTITAKLERFGGWVTRVGFVHSTVQKDKSVRNWGLGFSPDGSAYLYCSESPRYLAREKLAKASFDMMAVLESLRPVLLEHETAEATVRVEVCDERVLLPEGMLVNVSTFFLSEFEFRQVFKMVLDAIEEPSEALKNELKKGSPLSS